MSSAAPQFTPYRYVNEAVQLLLENVRGVLGDYFIGLYLSGSLAGGDFNPGRSDIDFVVMTSTEIPEKLIPELEKAHRRVWNSGLLWAKKLEGTYFPLKSIYRHEAGDPPRPHVWQDKFFISPQEDWIIDRYILRQSGIVIAGPPLKPLIALVTPADLRRSVIDGLRIDWAPRLNDREWITPPQNQNFVVFTNCRSLYTLKYGTVKSKPVSARWALKALGKQWRDLIECALAWHHGMPAGNIEKTLQMMKYTLVKAQSYQSKLSGSL